MIDLHSHILFETDDGSKSFTESINILKEAYNSGFTTIVATPHYLEPQFAKNVEENEKKLKILQQMLKEQDILIDLKLGNEVYITHKIEQLVDTKKVKMLGDSDYLLFELPMFQKLDSAVEIIRNLPYDNLILAHPERYVAVQKDINYLNQFVEMGVLLQCNYESILGKYGLQAKRVIKKLLKKKMVDLLSSDVHRQNSTYTRMEQIESKLLKVINREYFDYLTNENPKRILGI